MRIFPLYFLLLTVPFLISRAGHPQIHMVPTKTPPSLLRETGFKGRLNSGIILTVFCIPSHEYEWVMEIYRGGRVILSAGNGYFSGMIASPPKWSKKGSPTVVLSSVVLAPFLSKCENMLLETRFPKVEFDGVVDSIKFVLESGHMFAEFREPYSGQLSDLAKDIQGIFDMCLASGLYVKSDILPMGDSTEKDKEVKSR